MGKKGRAEKLGKPPKETSFDDNVRTALEAALPTPGERRAGKPSSLLDTRVIYCGDCLEQLEKLPPACVDLIYIDPWCEEIELSFHSNRNYEVFWGETKEKRAFEDRHANALRSSAQPIRLRNRLAALTHV